MRIVSTIVRTDPDGAPRAQLYLVFDTFAGAKRFTTAIVQSLDGGQKVSPFGQQVLDFARTHHDAQQQQPSFVTDAHLVQVMASSTARSRAVDAFDAAADGSLVIFFGADDGVCAELMRALGLHLAGRPH